MELRKVHGVEVCPHGMRWSGLTDWKEDSRAWCAECSGAAVAFGLVAMAQAILARKLSEARTMKEQYEILGMSDRFDAIMAKMDDIGVRVVSGGDKGQRHG
jgi:hypothetical protein